MFFGYSYDRTSIVSNDATNLNGWEATLEGKFLPWIGLVADVDGHYGSQSFNGTSANIAAHNALFGPRVSVQVKRFRPFAEFLVGVGHISRSNGISDSDTSFADGVGGGLDYRVFGPVTCLLYTSAGFACKAPGLRVAFASSRSADRTRSLSRDAG